MCAYPGTDFGPSRCIPRLSAVRSGGTIQKWAALRGADKPSGPALAAAGIAGAGTIGWGASKSPKTGSIIATYWVSYFNALP